MWERDSGSLSRRHSVPGPQGWFGCLGEEESLWSLPGIAPQLLLSNLA